MTEKAFLPTLVSRRFEALDSWRGICALLVAFFHVHAVSHVAEFGLVQQGGYFIVFFFVLSGFVIASNYEQKLESSTQVWKFIARRLGRLYPLHFALLITIGIRNLFITGSFLGHETGAGKSLLISLLLPNGLGLEAGYGWNPPSWSISTEFFTYILFSLLLLSVKKHRSAMFIGVVISSCIATSYFTATDHHGFIFGCIANFFSGVLTWALFRTLNKKFSSELGGIPNKVRWTFVEMAVVLGLWICLFHPADAPVARNLLRWLFVSLIVLVYAFERGALSKGLKTPIPLYLGTLSYSIYLIHDLWVHVTYGHFMDCAGLILSWLKLTELPPSQNSWFGDIYYAVFAASLIGVSHFTYRYIEKPARDFVQSAVAPIKPS